MPNIKPNSISKLVKLMQNNDCDIGTLASYIKNKSDIFNPNVVKVHIDKALKDDNFLEAKDFFRIKKNLNNELKVFNLASSKEIHDTFVEIEEMLLGVGYLLKHTSKAKISKFKNFILRANTSMHEINVLRGIVHQINWFLNNPKKNK